MHFDGIAGCSCEALRHDPIFFIEVTVAQSFILHFLVVHRAPHAEATSHTLTTLPEVLGPTLCHLTSIWALLVLYSRAPRTRSRCCTSDSIIGNSLMLRTSLKVLGTLLQ